MKRITCKECLFWDVGKDHNGKCRKNTPLSSDYWPETTANSWCGEAQPLKTYNEMETK